VREAMLVVQLQYIMNVHLRRIDGILSFGDYSMENYRILIDGL